MATLKRYQAGICRLLLLFSLISVIALVRHWPASAEQGSLMVRKVREFTIEMPGFHQPVALAFSARTSLLYLVETSNPVEVSDRCSYLTLITQQGERVAPLSGTATPHATLTATGELYVAFDGKYDRIFLLAPGSHQLIAIKSRADGTLDMSTRSAVDISRFGLQNPQAIAVDGAYGHLYVLDRERRELVRIEPAADGGLLDVTVDRVELDLPGATTLLGLAFDSSAGRLHLLDADSQALYEVTRTGELVAVRDLTPLDLHDLQGMAFGPSGDLTDDPDRQSLYIVTGGITDNLSRRGHSQPSSRSDADPAPRSCLDPVDDLDPRRRSTADANIVELSLLHADARQTVHSSAVTLHQADLVRIIETAQFQPPSPDPTGITYIDATHTLLLSDSEVNEIPTLFEGDNLWEFSLSGGLQRTATTIPFSDEPTGIAYNHLDGHFFLSDDTGDRSVYELNPGLDGLYGTDDDIITSFLTEAFGSYDPEGVAIDGLRGLLYIADSLNNEIYRVSWGSNERFDGIPPAGDDSVTSFDTTAFGLFGPQGITIDTANDRLYLVGHPTTLLAETTLDGIFVRMIDISEAGAVMPGGLAYVPSEMTSAATTVYVTDRGVDDTADPDENDGKVYGFSFSPSNGLPPTVNAGSDAQITLPNTLDLDADVSDDGLPGQPGTVDTEWSQVEGPGLVTFGDSGATDTVAAFTLPGRYVLRLVATDGEFVAEDRLTVIVNGVPSVNVMEVGIADSSDDAEERPSGSVWLDNRDLELVDAQGGSQIVGLRFTQVEIPRDAQIVHAYVQFQADESGALPASLLVQGEAADDADTFDGGDGSIGSRPRTSEAVRWVPAPWESVGQAGFDQRTPNLAPVIQEIITRSGWESNNALALLITGTGLRTAVAFDGSEVGAARLHVEYYLPEANNAPVVEIDAALTVTLPNGIQLAGNVVDDGLPNPPGILSTNWSQVSGPGTVSFVNAARADTTAHLPADGIYVIRLTANDGLLQMSADVTVTVKPPQAATIYVPYVVARLGGSVVTHTDQ